MWKPLLLLLLSCAADPTPRTWDFEADTPGRPPSGFSFARTGEGPDGRWEIRAVFGEAGGGKVLAQLDEDETALRFPIALADGPELDDFSLSVRCRAVSGQVDQAMGLVFRYCDADNYYLARANALEGNVRLYFVKDGRRQQIGSWEGAVPAAAWNRLEARADGDELQVIWNGDPVLEVRDETFPGPGKVGVWTKADSVSWFDELRLSPGA